MRRFILVHRQEEDAELARRAEIRRIRSDVYLDLYRGRVVNAYEVADQIREAGK